MFTNIISSIFGVLCVLFPKKESRVRGETIRQATEREYHEILLKEKSISSILGDTVHQISYYRYKNTHIRPVLLDIKRGKLNNHTIALCESVLDELISEITDRPFSAHTHAHVRKYLVYIPSSAFFTGKKDFDHMERVLTHFESTLSAFFIVCKNAILIRERTVDTDKTTATHGATDTSRIADTRTSIISQHHLSRNQRFAQSEGKFKLNESFVQHIQNVGKRLPYGHKIHIYCIDDITTSGATFKSVRDLIKSRLPTVQVSCIAIGH